MIASTVVVAASYTLPLVAMAVAGMSMENFSTGDWIAAAKMLGGPLLGTGDRDRIGRSKG